MREERHDVVPINDRGHYRMNRDLADRATNPTGLRRRRFWSSDEKRRIVAESTAPGASVSKVAQRHGVNANLSVHLAASAG